MIPIFSYFVGVLSTKIYSQTVMSNIYQVKSAIIPRSSNKIKIMPEESKSNIFKIKIWILKINFIIIFVFKIHVSSTDFFNRKYWGLISTSN